MVSLFLVLLLGTLSVQSALLPTTPLSQNNIETIVGCERKVFSWNVATSEPQFSLSVLVSALSAADITIYFTRDAPDDIHFQDSSCDLGVSCTAAAGTSCQVTQDCTATGMWYVIVTTPSSGEENFSLNTTLSPISVITLPVGTKSEDLYDNKGIVTGGLLMDGASDFFVVTLPTLTETQQLVVRVNSIAGTLNGALNPSNIAGASCSALHSRSGFTATDFIAPPCEVESGSSWYITVTRTQDDQTYQVKAWVEELATTVAVNGDPLHITHVSQFSHYITITGIDQLTENDDLVVSLENSLSQEATIYLTSKELVPICAAELAKEPSCTTSYGLCMLSVSPCDRTDKPNWSVYFVTEWDHNSFAGEWTIRAYSRNVELEKRRDHSSIFGSLAQSERALFSVPKPKRMNDWLEFDLYMTDFEKDPFGAYLALYVYKDDKICKDNVMKACSYQNNGNTVISCTVQLDPCELDEFDDDHIHFAVVSEIKAGTSVNTVHDSLFTVDVSVRNPYREPDRIQKGEIVTDGLPEYQYVNWPQLTRQPLTRVYYVEPVPFGNFTFTFTPTAGSFLVQFFDIKENRETKIGPSCPCWGANRVVNANGDYQRVYSVDNYDPTMNEEFRITFPRGLFIAVQPASTMYDDYEFNLGYTVRASNPTYAGVFHEGVQYKIEGLVQDEYRFYELGFHRRDLAFRYMVLDLKTIPDQVSFALFSLSKDLLTAFREGATREFLQGEFYFYENLPMASNGQHVFVSDCAWDLDGDNSHWILFVYSQADEAQFNMEFNVIRANPKRLTLGEPLNGELNRNEYHYFEVDVPQSAIDENKQLIVEVYFDQRHQPGTSFTDPATFYLYHRGPSEYTVLTGAGDCRCHDDSVSGTENALWVGRLCDLEAGLHTFSLRIPQQNPIPYLPKYTIKAHFVDLYQGEVALGVPTNGEVYYGQTVHYSFTPPASLFDTNNADSKLVLSVVTPHGEDLSVRVVEQNTTCTCPGTIFDSDTGDYVTFEWDYCTTTASSYYLSITPASYSTFPIKYTISMKSDVRHPEVVALTLVNCNDPQPEPTFVYNRQYRQYSLSITGSVSFRIQITDVVDGTLSVYRNDEDIAVSGCGNLIGNYGENFGSTYNIDECTTGDTSFHIGIFGVSNFRHDAVRYRIRACSVTTNPTYQPLGTRRAGTLAAGDTVRFYYNLPANFPITLGKLYFDASFSQGLNFGFGGEPKVCVNCDPYAPPSSLVTTYQNFVDTCSLPPNVDRYEWYIELSNPQFDNVDYNVTVSSFLATAAPITIGNNVETVVNIPSHGWVIYRYTPVNYDPTQIGRNVRTSITAATSGSLNYYSRTSSESCDVSVLAVTNHFCCEDVIDIIFFNPTATAHSANLTVSDNVIVHYGTLAYPTQGATVSVNVPAAANVAVTEAYTYKLSYPATYIPYSTFNYNFSDTTYVSTNGPYYPGISWCTTSSTQFSGTLGNTDDHSSVVSPNYQVYLTVAAASAARSVTFEMKQVAPISVHLGESWTGTLSETTPFYLDLSTFSRSVSRTLTFEVSASSSVTINTPFGTFVGTNPAIPSAPGCTTLEFVRFLVTPSSTPITLNFSSSYEEDPLDPPPGLIYIPAGETRTRVYPGAPTDWTFETHVPPVSQLTETSTLVFSLRLGHTVDSSDAAYLFGCGTPTMPSNLVCLPTKDGEQLCTIIFTRSELVPSSFLSVYVSNIASDWSASFELLNPTMHTVSDQAEAFSVSVGQVVYLRWDSTTSMDEVRFVATDSCGDVRFYYTGGDSMPSKNSVPTMVASPSSNVLNTLTLTNGCFTRAFHTVAAVLADSRNAETSVGFSVIPIKPDDLPEIRTIFVNEIHTLMGRSVADDPEPASTCPNPYVSSSVSTEQCDCPVATTKYATDDVVYQLTFDGFYTWDPSQIHIEPSEYVTGITTQYYLDFCGTPVTMNDPISFVRHVFIRITATGYDVPSDVDGEFPVATIHTTTHRQGKIPVAFSEEPQYILFTLAEDEVQYFEIIHDESGRLDYAPSIRVVAVINGSVGIADDSLATAGYATTAGTRCLDRIAYPDCPESFTSCNAGFDWTGFYYAQNLFNRTYVKLAALDVADDAHVVRGIVEVRFIRPYTMVTFEEDKCYELEPDNSHVMFFNSSQSGRMTIYTVDNVAFRRISANNPTSYILDSGCGTTCNFGTSDYYILVRNFDEFSNGHYQLSWEPNTPDETTVGTLNLGLNTIGLDNNCAFNRPTQYEYTKASSDALLLAYWNPIAGTSSSVTTDVGSRSGTQFIPICVNNDIYDFTISADVHLAELTLYEISATPTSLTPDAAPTKVPLPAAGGTLAFSVDVTDEDFFAGSFERSLSVSITLDNAPNSPVLMNAVVFDEMGYCGSAYSAPHTFSIGKCDGNRQRVYYVHVPEQEKCGGVTVIARAYWVDSDEESNPTGTDITFLPNDGEILPFKFVTTFDEKDFVYFRVSNVRGTTGTPQLRVHIQSTSCCLDPFTFSGGHVYRLCGGACTGKVNIFAVLLDSLTLLPGFTHVTLDLEVVQIPRQILPQDGTEVSFTISDQYVGSTLIEAPLLPYSGHSYVFNITSGSPLQISFLYPCSSNSDASHTLYCLPGAECQLSVPTPHHLASAWYHGYDYAKFNIFVVGKDTVFTARLANTPAQVCSTVDQDTAPFCSAVLTGEQWSISANHHAADLAAEKLFDQLVDDFSCNSFTGTDCTCPGKVSRACEEAIKAFACHQTFLECNSDGFGQTTSATSCMDVEKHCGKAFIDAVPESYYAKYDCRHNHYAGGVLFVDSPVPDYEERPIHFIASASHIFSIFTLVLILALLTL